MRKRPRLALLAAPVIGSLGACTSALAAGQEGGEHLGEVLPLWSALPFAGILLSIALFPLLRPHFWHRHYPKVAAFWGIAFAVPFVIAYRGAAVHSILHIYLLDYVPFIILLWSLFTVAGGIVVRGTLHGGPRTNTALLAIGTAIASWIGTTGASMLLIRPMLRANARRRYRMHVVVFFIFLVSNIGGSLTPLGDPPLFLGFLHHVPFFWTFHLAPHMLFVAAVLLGLFYLIDARLYARETFPEEQAAAEREPVRVAGLRNFVFLAGIVTAVLLSGLLHWRSVDIAGVHVPLQNLLRDVVLVACGLLSLRATPRHLRVENQFGWEPIREVAILFAGIFATIVPALAILAAGDKGHLAGLIRAVEEPWHFFWITGGLSSFLDNAPTYLTFLNTALGRFVPGQPEREAVHALIAEHEKILAAIAAGAVFMGANTYIGNAPNFMVRSIAEEAGVDMPSFFGYFVRWALPILVPCFLLVTWIFFR